MKKPQRYSNYGNFRRNKLKKKKRVKSDLKQQENGALRGKDCSGLLDFDEGGREGHWIAVVIIKLFILALAQPEISDSVSYILLA